MELYGSSEHFGEVLQAAAREGHSIGLVTGKDGQAPWFEIDNTGAASRVFVAISFVDDAGCGGMVTATALVDR